MTDRRPELVGTHGMVASTHWLASQSGMAVLEAGGNAFDAAVAAGFVLQVVEPEMNGPGGDLVLIFRAPDAEPTVLCGQGPAPAGATLDHYRGEGLEVVPGTGLLAAAVPGATPAWLKLLHDHGTMTPAQVLDFAIGYADSGFPISERAAGAVDAMTEVFVEHWPSSAATWLPAPQPNRLVRNPDLAVTYRSLISSTGDRDRQCRFAREQWAGPVAEAIGSFARKAFLDSSGRAHAGVITAADCADWHPTYEPAVVVEWRGHRLHKPGRWSQGPVFTEILALIDPLLGEEWTGEDPAELHTVIEAMKLAFVDRDAWLGDGPEAVDPSALQEPEFLETRRQLIGSGSSDELRPGGWPGRAPRLPRPVHAPEVGPFGTGEPTLRRPQGDTCHLDVADRWGNVVSATPSGGWLQSSPVIEGLGFPLGTRLQMTWLQPGLPSTLGPGRRPRTTLSPSLAVAPDGRVTAFGTPGGDQQDQWPLGFWLHHALSGLDLQQAIEQPAWHTASLISSFDPREFRPGVLIMEDRVPRSTVDALRHRGHRVELVDGWSLGRISAVSYDPGTGLLHGAANPRGGQGYAVGR